MRLRHEWKHVINDADRLMLETRLDAIMERDAHATEGSYTVRSLYFDTPRDRALREKLDGVANREKFRIRSYGRDLSFITLEKKVKRNSLGFKMKAPLSASQTARIIDGDIDWMIESDYPLIRELYCKMTLERLEPKTVVEYDRVPFVVEEGNTRVTLDSRLRTTAGHTDFLDLDYPMISVNPSISVLEVKWDEFLPSLVRDAVQMRGRRTAAFSKYAMCRALG